MVIVTRRKPSLSLRQAYRKPCLSSSLVGPKTTLLFIVGTLGGIGNGAVYPALAYLFSNSFSDISGAATQGLSQIRTLAYNFLVVGVFALVMATIQTTAFELVAYRASQNLRLRWFKSLLRQDPAFFDVHDIAGIANNVVSYFSKLFLFLPIFL